MVSEHPDLELKEPNKSSLPAQAAADWEFADQAVHVIDRYGQLLAYNTGITR